MLAFILGVFRLFRLFYWLIRLRWLMFWRGKNVGQVRT
jgi:hypothetical protein